jgi:tryptophan-rich sensory protein
MTGESGSIQTRHWLRDLPVLAIFVAVTALAAASGAIARPGEWYAALNKPPGTPPDRLFPIAWGLLYALIAVAGWLVWRQAGLRRGLAALVPFAGQLGANGLWSILFFGLNWPWLALADLIVLWGLIVLTMVRFWRFSPTATALLAPYLAWVSYAGYLNLSLNLINGL